MEIDGGGWITVATNHAPVKPSSSEVTSTCEPLVKKESELELSSMDGFVRFNLGHIFRFSKTLVLIFYFILFIYFFNFIS